MSDNKVICYYCNKEFTAHKINTKCAHCKHDFVVVYPLTISEMDSMGCITVTLAETDQDVFFQFESDIDAIKECLNKSQWEVLNNGYILYSYSIPDDYFMSD